MNRTERKEIETQVREIICQMKEKQKEKAFFVNIEGLLYTRVRYSPWTRESWNRPYFKMIDQNKNVWVVHFKYL